MTPNEFWWIIGGPLSGLLFGAAIYMIHIFECRREERRKREAFERHFGKAGE